MVIIFLATLLSDDLSWEVPWTGILEAAPEHRLRPSDARFRRQMRAIGEKLASEIESKAPMWDHAVRHGLAQLLIEVARAQVGWRSAQRVCSPATSFGHVLPAVRLAQENPVRRVTAEEAARSCGLSRSRFRHLFRQTMGVSFREFALRARVAYAAQLLVANKDWSVSEIADRLGFVDCSHLHRAFVKRYSCTPSAFRENAGPAPARPRPSVLFPVEPHS